MKKRKLRLKEIENKNLLMRLLEDLKQDVEKDFYLNDDDLLYDYELENDNLI
ncbi:MAG: hypothetical protein Q8N08_05720 [Methanobacteriaceae archaeon]|nr:hypothetical protein [Methanobacteriaceae archaeon]